MAEVLIKIHDIEDGECRVEVNFEPQADLSNPTNAQLVGARLTAIAAELLGLKPKDIDFED